MQWKRNQSMSSHPFSLPLHWLAAHLTICSLLHRSKPMQEILNRLNAHNEFQIIVFEDHLIANSEPEDWPVCDALITFSSSDFPTEKGKKLVHAVLTHQQIGCFHDSVQCFGNDTFRSTFSVCTHSQQFDTAILGSHF